MMSRENNSHLQQYQTMCKKENKTSDFENSQHHCFWITLISENCLKFTHNSVALLNERLNVDERFNYEFYKCNVLTLFIQSAFIFINVIFINNFHRKK